MAIYPVIDGQKLDSRHTIPPHSPSTKPADTHEVKNHIDDDLINFGNAPVAGPTASKPVQPEVSTQPTELTQQPLEPVTATQTPKPVEPAQPAKTAEYSATSKNDIETLLSSTGKPAQGPLIDFSKNLKKDLPSTKQ